MINDRAVERRCKRSELTRLLPVTGSDRSALAVGEDDTGALMRNGVGKDFIGGNMLTELVASVARKMEAPGFRIDMRNPEHFARLVLLCEAAGKENSRGLEAIELEREFGTLVPHQQPLGRQCSSSGIIFDPNRPTIVETDQIHLRLGAAASSD